MTVSGESVSRETWRDVPDEPGYQVSDLGRVRGPSGREIGTIHARGYVRVILPGHRYAMRHTLVAAAFLGPANGARVYRIDPSDPTNDRPDNLRYGLPARGDA